MPNDRPRDAWERVAASLRAYRTAQEQTWGGLDDMVIARFLAGTATEEERRAVEEVAAKNPAVAELLSVVRGVFAELPEVTALTVTEAARQKKVSETTLRAAVESGELTAVRTGDGFTIPAGALAAWEPKAPAKPTAGWTAIAASAATGAILGGVGGAVLGGVLAAGALSLLASGTSASAWNWASRWMSDHLIPHLRQSLGDTVADSVTTVVAWAEGKVTLTREDAIAASKVFSEHVLEITATFQKVSATTATAELVMTVRAGETARRITLKEENIPLDQVSDKVREEFIRKSTEPVTLDIRDAIRRAAIQKGTELGVTAEELTLAS